MRKQFLVTIGSVLSGRTSSYFVIIVFTVITFYPALNRLPVDDQIWYLAELDGATSLWDGLALTDYALSRSFFKGDELLYRPFLFAWLAVANSAFSYHYEYWNLGNLVLHVLLVISLFELLRTISPSQFALPFALIFSVSPTVVELVLFPHLGGCIIGLLLLAVALRYSLTLTSPSGVISYRTLSLVVALLSLSAMFYEYLVIAPIFIAGYLVFACRNGSRQKLLLFSVGFAPVIIYSIAYLPHFFQATDLLFVHGTSENRLGLYNIIAAPFGSAKATIRWAVEFFLPTTLTFQIQPFHRFGKLFDAPYFLPAFALNIVISVGILGLTIHRVIFSLRWNTIMLFGLLTSLLLGYSFMIVLGRGYAEARGIAYYQYLPCLLLTVSAYSLLVGPSHGRLYGWLLSGLIGSLLAINFSVTSALVRDIKRVNEAPHHFFEQLVNFVDQNKTMPGFSFQMVDNTGGKFNPDVTLVIGYPDDPASRANTLPLAAILFRKYLSKENPTHKLVIRSGQ